jgi:hypothetical protein
MHAGGRDDHLGGRSRTETLSGAFRLSGQRVTYTLTKNAS